MFARLEFHFIIFKYSLHPLDDTGTCKTRCRQATVGSLAIITGHHPPRERGGDWKY
ncbi:MAG: hypothetical protein ACE5RG_02950 [Candidatus Nitrosomaritimum yanchengensis]